MISILRRDRPVSAWTSDHVKDAETAAHWFVTLLISAGLGAIGKWLQNYLARRAAVRLIAKQINPQDPHEKTLREIITETRSELDKANEVRREQQTATAQQFESLRSQMEMLKDGVSEQSERYTDLSRSMNDMRRELNARDEKAELRDLELRRSLKRLRKVMQTAQPKPEGNTR